ncbi:hypothetical protein JXB28_01405 [Candidatus Woesearchaeota archaeon]|nr:hypothetical protein [Candidatus Woesearchaeota archaeon]
MANFFKEIGKFLLGEGLSKFTEKVDKTIKDVEKKIEIITMKVIKTSILFLMMCVGAIFLLVGLSQYLNSTVPALRHGLGTVVVGAVLIALALFVKAMK